MYFTGFLPSEDLHQREEADLQRLSQEAKSSPKPQTKAPSSRPSFKQLSHKFLLKTPWLFWLETSPAHPKAWTLCLVFCKNLLPETAL